jgi:phosphoribosylamine--glycine ligase
MAATPQVGIVLGSDSDLPQMEGALDVLDGFAVGYEITVASAHRTPDRAAEFARTARDRGLRVLIAAAGGAAHLAGALAANCTLPVVGVPLAATTLAGFDALLATVQMPPGVPVATVGVGSWGAQNAAILAVQILALSDDELRAALRDHKEELVTKTDQKVARLEARLEARRVERG